MIKSSTFTLLVIVIFTIATQSSPINDSPSINVELTEYPRSPNLNFTEYLKLRSSALLSRDNNVKLNGASYVGEIRINGKKFKMLLDTESSELWVPSAKFSGPFNDLKKSSVETYGMGSVELKFGTTDVTIAGLTAKNQTLGLATNIFGGKTIHFDGILGLGSEFLSFEKRPTLISTLVKQGLVKEPQFAFHLSKNKAEPSTFTIGGVDKSKFTGKVHFSSVIDKTGRWFIELGGVSVNNKETSIEGTEGAVIQSSTSKIHCPKANAREFYKKIPGSTEISDGIYAIPCDSKVNVSIKLAGQLWSIPSSDFILQKIPKKPNYCEGAVEGRKLRYWIFGTSFMKNVYTVYQIGKKQAIGLAKLSR